MRAWKYVLIISATCALGFVPGEAQAQRSITCESQNDRLRNCQVPNLDQFSVQLVRRLSDTGCIKDSTWGTDRNRIWVSGGCRAEFEYRLLGELSGNNQGGRSEITCESSNGQLQNCRVPGLNQQSVRLERTLSSTQCVNGRTWGTMPNIIWVESGCRAVFSYDSPGGGNNSGQRELTCESSNGQLQNCRVPGLNQQSVRLIRTLSSTQCINGQTWGTMPNIIWVESGCRAVFTYETGGGGGVSEANNPNRRYTMTCESQGSAVHNCRIANLDLGSVTIERVLSNSPCNRDDSWGTQRGLIWVSKGCRAEFSYRINN